MRWKGLVSLILGLSFITIITGCADDPESETESGRILSPQEQQFNQHVQLLAAIQQDEVSDPVVKGVTTNNNIAPVEGSDYKIVTTTYEASEGFSEMLSLNPAEGVIYPGALLRGESIASGEYTPITARRADLKMSVSLSGLTNNLITVPELTLSSYRNAINRLLGGQDIRGNTAARVAFTVKEVYSSEHLALTIGAAYNAPAGLASMNSEFSFSSTRSNCNILVKFLQVYYTVDIDIPVEPTDLFSEHNNWEVLAGQLSSSNISPVYVSSISYGRMALFSVKSSLAASRVKAALHAAAKTTYGEGSVDIESDYQNTLDQCEINAYIVGGSAQSAVGAVTGYEGFKEYLARGANFSLENPGLPISYQLRYLHDNSISDVVLTSKYKIAKAIRVRNAREVKVRVRLVCNSVHDSGDEEELYGRIRVTAYTGPTTNLDMVDGFIDHYPSDGLVWDIPWHRGVDWRLKEGERKDIGNDIVFRFNNQDSLESCYIKVEGDLYEQDSRGSLLYSEREVEDGVRMGYKDDRLGRRSKTVGLTGYSSSQGVTTYRVTGFGHGGTSVSIEFDILPAD